MKKILLSLSAIVFVGAAAVGATGAFFSDVETSTGNTFTAGSIDLKVDAQAHYAGLKCSNEGSAEAPAYVWVLEGQTTTRPDLLRQPCDGTWTLTDLGPTNKFFNLSDVKPGDQGENTISLHVDNNDAWACADVAITENSDQTCVSPENASSSENGACVPEGANGTNGDLAQDLQFVAWNDNASTSGAVPGDNIHQPGEVLYFNPGPASNVLNGGSLTLADGGTGTPLPGGSTRYVGLAWCAGTMTATTGGGAPTCNGATMGNKAQTDSMKANFTFRVEQSRNNPNFRCQKPVD